MGMLQLVTQAGVCLTHNGHVTTRDTGGSVSHTQWACYKTRLGRGGVGGGLTQNEHLTTRDTEENVFHA